MTSWSKRKRIEATIAGEKTDRIPVALWRHWPGDDQDASALAAAHIKWQQDYDWDLLKVSPSSSFAIHDWGAASRWVGASEGTREYVGRVVNSPEDWEKLHVLNPYAGMLGTQITALKMVGAGLGSAVPYIATIFSPLAQAKNLAGNERLLSHMRSYPDSVRRGLQTISESTLRYIDAAKATGIDGIFYAIQHSRYPLMNPAEYKTFGEHFDLPILASVSDLNFNMVHIHSTEIMFDSVAHYPVQLFNWHDREAEISLRDGLERIGGAASGGVSRWSMHQEGSGQVLAEIADARQQTDDRRLLLGTGCVIMVTTPTQNIRTFREAVENS